MLTRLPASVEVAHVRLNRVAQWWISSGQNHRTIEDILRETIQALRHGKEEVFKLLRLPGMNTGDCKKSLSPFGRKRPWPLPWLMIWSPSPDGSAAPAPGQPGFPRYSEQDIKDAYETAHRLMSNLTGSGPGALLRQRRRAERALINISDLARGR